MLRDTRHGGRVDLSFSVDPQTQKRSIPHLQLHFDSVHVVLTKESLMG